MAQVRIATVFNVLPVEPVDLQVLRYPNVRIPIQPFYAVYLHDQIRLEAGALPISKQHHGCCLEQQ